MELPFAWPGALTQGWRGWHLQPESRSFDPSVARQLLAVARQSAVSAYAPHSNFHVGAALRMADDPEQRVFAGVNMENASYGAAICAERTALGQAISAGFRQLEMIAIATPDAGISPLNERSPCGICRQVMREFADSATTLILLAGVEPGVEADVLTMEAILPHGFRFDG